MRYFMTITGILITLMLLLAILAGSAQARAAAPRPTEGTQPADGSPMIYLALVGGAASLAALVWLGMLRRVQKPSLNQDTAHNLTSNDGETE
jgi:hypothetical protein